MSNIFHSVREKLNRLKPLRKVLVSLLVLTLIVSVTWAWYINKTSINGIEFSTGNIEFNTYFYDDKGEWKAGPVSSDEDDPDNEANGAGKALITLTNVPRYTYISAYIAIENCGTLGIDYRLSFGFTGMTDEALAYLGGYRYNVTPVTNDVTFVGGNANLGGVSSEIPEGVVVDKNLVNIDKNAELGRIQLDQEKPYVVYRVDLYLEEKPEEYTGKDVKIYFNVSATQIGGDLDNKPTGGAVRLCSTYQDIDRAKTEAYPGDIIRLTNNITYYGDLVFNNAVNIETNNFTLTVVGNLIYDYVLGTGLELNAGGRGRIIVRTSNIGAGGNLTIKAPLSQVSLVGSNDPNGDFIVEKNVTVQATNTYGSPGVSFNNVKILEFQRNALQMIQLDSNTRATVSFGTSIGIFKAVDHAQNIEIVNNGEIGEIILSNMDEVKPQTNSPQIFITNNNIISNPIALPDWSEKFVETSDGYVGNTRIIQSLTGSATYVTGSDKFTNNDVENEIDDSLVGQIVEGDDSRLRIYYQDDAETNTTHTIESILKNYFATEAAPGYTLATVVQLEIVSIGDKAVTLNDIKFLNSSEMYSLHQLDMQRANMVDNKLPDGSFSGISKYDELVLPQNLTAIGSAAFSGSAINNIITVPSGVTEYGTNWFYQAMYVRFASTYPVAAAVSGNNMKDAKAIFVDEAYITDYKTTYSGYATRIYPTSVMDGDGLHFVRNTKDDEWEITYYIGREDAELEEIAVIGENVTLDDGTILKITSVYDNAFRHNYKGTEVNFSNTVENLGAANFYANAKITKVNLNKLKYLGDEVFYNASALASIAFGDSLETIGANAFFKCISLTDEIILPETMQKIGAYAFSQTKIKSINTGGTTSIDGGNFAQCKDLLSAELPNVITVGENGTNSLFFSCSSLVSAKMPSLSKALGTNMFASCTSLREVYMASNNDDVTLGTSVFSQVDINQIKLYVPEEYLAFYQSKRPGNIKQTMIYPDGEKMGTQLINGYNIGNYIVRAREDGTYSLVTSNLSYTDALMIPETYNGKAITHIYANAFRNQSITNVTLKLGNNIRSIGSYAFYQLNGLVQIEFGTSLETIDSYAFANCTNLVQNIVLPDSMDSLGSGAFAGSGILRVNTGGATSVDTQVFSSCKSLVYAEFPEVTTVAASGTNQIFLSCTSLVGVDMPKLSKASGAGMFGNCNALLELYMGSDNATASLGTNPFANVGNTRQIKLFVPENLVSFYRNDINITGITDGQIYPRGEKLGDLTVNGVLVGDYVVLENEDGYTLVTSNLSYEGDETVPDTYMSKPITQIGEYAFSNQSFTEANLVLGANVKIIGDNAFNATTGLRSVAMDQVTTIGKSAFNGSGIKTLNAPKLVSVGNDAFRSCASLVMVSVPRIVNIDSTYVFANCTELESVYFENVMTLSQSTFNNDTKLAKITINRTINSSGDNMPSAMKIEATAPCTIYVPYNSLSAYGATWSEKPVATFDISVTYNDNRYILSESNGRYTLIGFEASQTVTTFTLPGQVETITIYSIAEGAFSSVAGTMKSLTLPSTVALLSGDALSECTALENIYVSADNAYFSSIGGVLYSKDARVLVKYPAGKAGTFDMTASDYASTVGIAAYAFANAKIDGITFPASLVMIDSTAFANCENLTTVEFTGNTPPVLMGAGIFNTKVNDFQMIVPSADTGVLTAYLWAFNFVEYEPYIALPSGYEKPAQNDATSITAPVTETDSERGERIAEFARGLVGSPYVYGGTSPDGFDCSGFVQYVYRENGIIINRTADEQSVDGYSVSFGDMIPGDLIYFGDGEEVTHVGIYLGEDQFVHAQNSVAGVVISNVFDSYYANRFMYARRIVG